MSQTYSNEPAAKPSNGLGTAGFVVGLVGLVISFLPVIGVVAWPLVVLGVIFSAIGIAKVSKGRATNKGLSIAGLVLSIVGVVICAVWGAIINKADEEIEEEANREVTITYEVTGDAPVADIEYTTFSGDQLSTSSETGKQLPWTKEVTTKGLVKGGSLIVSTGEQGGSVTCRVLVDGRELGTNTATGQFAVATCAGF